MGGGASFQLVAHRHHVLEDRAQAMLDAVPGTGVLARRRSSLPAFLYVEADIVVVEWSVRHELANHATLPSSCGGAIRSHRQ